MNFRLHAGASVSLRRAQVEDRAFALPPRDWSSPRGEFWIRFRTSKRAERHATMFAVAVAQPFAAPRATAPLRARAIPPAAVSPVSCSHVSTKTDSDASLPARSASGLVAAAVAVTMTLAPVYAADASDTVFAGRYIDPNHPHCPREIDADGVITGIDPVPFVKGSGCRGYKKARRDGVTCGETPNRPRLSARLSSERVSRRG